MWPTVARAGALPLLETMLSLLLTGALLLPPAAAAPPPSTATHHARPPAGVGNDEGTCCRRESHFSRIGVDVFGDELSVDVGRCRRSCRRPSAISRRKFQQLWDDNPTADPFQLFLSRRRRSSCPGAGRCRASETVMQRHHTLRGAVTVAVTLACGCVTAPSDCTRVAHHVTYHAGTPQQRRVDVGACAGHCGRAHDSCKPLRNSTVAIDGPNGTELVSVIEECTCAHGCYRMSVLEQVYNYTDTDGAAAPRRQAVDVGQCVGACSPLQRGRDCVYSAAGEPGRCLMALQYESSGCVASGGLQHYYRDQQGNVHTLLSITDCTCR